MIEMMVLNPDATIPINEIFSSVQGEGQYTGRPAVFVRLQSCPVGCPFCDTKHTWEKKADLEIAFDAMLNKTTDAETWANVTLKQLYEYLVVQPEQLVVFTGGEPCLYDLEEISTALLDQDKDVQIETSGTEPIHADMCAWITVSPKLNMPGGRTVRKDALLVADEIKMPVGKQSDVDELKKLLDTMGTHIEPLIYLQPLSQSPKATELCIEQARLNGWRLSAQLHKFLKVR